MTKKEPVWIEKSALLLLHAQSLAEHGGGEGLRDEGLLDSALARPQNLFAYEQADICALAASYAYGIAKNHPFVDGNKRAALLACGIFLKANGHNLTAGQVEMTTVMLDLAGSVVSESDFATWIRAHLGKR